MFAFMKKFFKPSQRDEERFCDIFKEVTQKAASLKEERSVTPFYVLGQKNLSRVNVVKIGKECPREGLHWLREEGGDTGIIHLHYSEKRYNELIKPHLFDKDPYMEFASSLNKHTDEYAYEIAQFTITFEQIHNELTIAETHGYRISDDVLDGIFHLLDQFQDVCLKSAEEKDLLKQQYNNRFDEQFQALLRRENDYVDRFVHLKPQEEENEYERYDPDSKSSAR